MTDSPHTHEQAAHIGQELRCTVLRLAALRKAMQDAGWEIPEDVRRQLTEVRQRMHVSGAPWELIDATPGLEPLDDT